MVILFMVDKKHVFENTINLEQLQEQQQRW